jgi:hypothetical protein
MEGQGITDSISKLFEETTPILNSIYNGFAGHKINLLKERQIEIREFLKNGCRR